MPDRLRAFRRLLTATALLALLGHAMPAISQEATPTDGPPYRVGEGVTRPELLTSVRPVYTELARRARVTGTVIAEAIIDEHGDVTNVRVLKGLPMGLDQAATDAVKMWKFKPATLKGQPVKVYYVLTVNFQVDGALFGSGPMLAQFLKEHPELETQIRGNHKPDATALLDRLATQHPEEEAGIFLARNYLLMAGGSLQDAWQKAMDDHGPERCESLATVGAFAWKKAGDKARPADKRAEDVELGLQAETAALGENRNGVEALHYKSWLLRSKAELTGDAGDRQKLIDEADQLERDVKALQDALRGGPVPVPR
jgi:TonB family protein